MSAPHVAFALVLVVWLVLVPGEHLLRWYSLRLKRRLASMADNDG